MNDAMIRAWNALVDPDDDVWVLGDLAMGEIAETLPFVGQLAGRITFVPGNHDRCWTGNLKGVERWTAAYLDAGIDRIVGAPTHTNLAGRDVLATTSLTAATPVTSTVTSSTGRQIADTGSFMATSTRSGASRAVRSTSGSTPGAGVP